MAMMARASTHSWRNPETSAAADQDPDHEILELLEEDLERTARPSVRESWFGPYCSSRDAGLRSRSKPAAGRSPASGPLLSMSEMPPVFHFSDRIRHLLYS